MVFSPSFRLFFFIPATPILNRAGKKWGVFGSLVDGRSCHWSPLDPPTTTTRRDLRAVCTMSRCIALFFLALVNASDDDARRRI